MPTRLGTAFLVLLGGIGFAAVNTGNNLLYLLIGVGLASLGISALAAGSALRRLRPQVSLPEEIFAGEPTAVVVTLHHGGGRGPGPGVRARLRGVPGTAPEVGFAPLAPEASATRFVPARFPSRGLFPAPALTLETDDPFGLMRRRVRARPPGEFFVYPAPTPEEPRDHRWRRSAGEAPQRRIGEGLELHQIRPYRFDDDSRHLDWRATARVGELMVKEFLEEGAENLVLVFDPAIPAAEPAWRAAFEAAVSRAAALVLRCAERRVPFRFLAPERSFPDVDPPGGHRPVLEYLATIQPQVAPSAPPFGGEIRDLPGVVLLSARREEPS